MKRTLLQFSIAALVTVAAALPCAVLGRHRLATLGAVWSETLRNTPGALREADQVTDVARRAEELANQEPRDAKARELAMLASASSRLQSSGPTGSGR